jgi:hypothetical protein
MSVTFELRWLLLLPVGAIVVFALWVLWNLSCEIGARKRRWVITYRESDEKIGRLKSQSARLDDQREIYKRSAS